jgi:hypothetical protein
MSKNDNYPRKGTFADLIVGAPVRHWATPEQMRALRKRKKK